MAELTLSPCVFAMPDLSEGRSAFEEYLEGLLDWEAALRQNWVRVSISQNTMELLFETESYPAHPHIVRACQTFGIFEYSANDCRRIIDDLLGRACHFEDVCGIKDILWTNESFDPDISGLQRDQLRNEAKRILVILAAIHKHCSTEKINHVLGYKRLPERCSSVAVDALIEMMEPDTMGVLSAPFTLSKQVSVCSNFASFLMSLDPSAIWYAATDSAGVELAIRLGWFQESQRSGQLIEWETSKGIRLGHLFLKSSRDHGFCDDISKIKILLSSMVDTLLKRKLSKIHALRVSRGGNSPQKVRGNDKAWRRDVDYTYHLHYWETESGMPEFAAVVTHNNFSIPE